MYEFNKQSKTYTFKGSLSKYLLDNGVKSEDIEAARYKILESNYRSFYYKPTGVSELRPIPLEKVIGTNRSRSWTSVYDNVKCCSTKGISLDHTRFEDCFTFLKDLGVDKLRESYIKLKKPIHVSYYEDDDVYYVDLDGNHRTIVAMLVGAKQILADVDHYKCDINKKIQYDCIISTFKKKYNINKLYNTNGSEYNLLDCLAQTSKIKKLNIEFVKGRETYLVTNYILIINNGNLQDAVRKLSDQIDDDYKKLTLLKFIPKMFRDVFYKRKGNERLKDYMSKKINIMSYALIDKV